jgi:Immunoglobulin I-set domain
MKKHLLTLAISCLAAASLRADVLYQDLFNYTNGPIVANGTNANGTTNWFHTGGATATDFFVKNQRAEVASSSAAAGFPSRSEDVHCNFSTFTNAQTVLYASFMVSCTNLPPVTSTYFAHFYINSSTFHGRVFAQAGALPNTWRLGVSGANNVVNKVFPVDLATNVDYQVVVGWDATTSDAPPLFARAATLWVNPLNSSDLNSVTTGDAVGAFTSAELGYGFRQASGFGNAFMTVSNLVVATTFDEAATNVLATNAAAPAIVYQPTTRSNFVGDAFSLAAVATGQGLGDPNLFVYQWQKNDANFSNPGGNTNVLSFASAVVSDTGNYRVIVTTPYGLSSTSAEAFLWVTNPPVPPTIGAFSGTTNVFFHQDTTLHFNVVGPPPITFQWYYNGAPATGANVSGADTDTLTITDAFTNNGTLGAYTLVASNPFGSSTSAVVTVSSAGPVLIAYLRTLVDPVNYIATNSTTRWQVSGIVTTATNLTSGETSSYYLWDGTAGVNIFVTHGLAFRPNQGDILVFKGWLSSFFSTLELEADANDPSTSFTILSNNLAGLPPQKAIPFSITNNLPYCETNLEGSIVMLTNVYFGTNAGRVTTTNAADPNTVAIVTNAAGETFTILFSSQVIDTQGRTLPDFAYTVVGVFNQNIGNAVTPRNSGYEVEVSRFSDIVTTPLTLTAAAFGGTATLSWDAAPYSYAYSVLSASNVAGPYAVVTNNMHFTNSPGTYSESIGGVQKYFRLTTP